MVKLSFWLLCVLLTGCSLLDGPNSRNNRSNDSRPESRDVPFAARSSNDQSPRKRIMVLPFIDDGKKGSEASINARDNFVRALKRSDEFVVVAVSDFPKDITTYWKDGTYDLEAMAKVGAGLGLSAIIEGRILELKVKRLGDDVGIVREVRARIKAKTQVRVVNTKNGSMLINNTNEAEVEGSSTRIAERASGDGKIEEDPHLIEDVVNKSFAGAVPRIISSVDKLSWEGRVALVKGERIYMNAGRVSGIQIGDILKVTEEGEDVYDPDTGVLIGKVPGRLKGTLEVIAYFGKDGSVGLIHSGSGFRENDHVELY